MATIEICNQHYSAQQIFFLLRREDGFVLTAQELLARAYVRYACNRAMRPDDWREARKQAATDLLALKTRGIFPPYLEPIISPLLHVGK